MNTATQRVARFGLLTALALVLGLLDRAIPITALHGGAAESATAGIGTLPLVAGFVTAFVTGCLACKWMIGIVRRGKLVWFALYCALFGALLIAFA